MVINAKEINYDSNCLTWVTNKEETRDYHIFSIDSLVVNLGAEVYS